ncbi:hypothetical protein GQ44DRAFT_719628 [Phaeosphaeriaceae sp. PMI808]|nr:hypothetical protein GQ44DRAFT_719628 [Phaeosphaeriaceae sp. PMI808]
MSSLTLFARFTRYSPWINRKSLFPISQGCLSNRATTQLSVHGRIYPPRSSSRTMIADSPELNLRNYLEGLPIEKWGWVIYRCAYDDDQTWTRFRAHVESSSRESIAESDAPEIADLLEWTWVEDAASLNGVSTDALRKQFRAWAVDEVAHQPGDYEPPDISRFRYFIKVDEEALQSLAQPDPFNPSRLNTAFVKLVDGNWEPDPSPAIAEKKEEDEDDFSQEGALEPIDGCAEEDVGWMRISPFMINADFYEVLGSGEDQWYIFYERPPSIVVY